jgi:hypothetical protein
MKVFAAGILCLLLAQAQLLAWDVGTVRLDDGDLGRVGPSRLDLSAECQLGYSYLLDGCGYVTVVDSIDEGQCFGVRFNMSDQVQGQSPCDTNACMMLDVVELVFYDALPSPADQSMNLKVYGADDEGEPVGSLLGNRDFEVGYTDTAEFTVVEIDFTNGGVEPGLDLSGCRGCFVALLTWMNPTGHPCLVLDNVGTCVESCPGEPACCEMGTPPYTYPRGVVHTYYYGFEPVTGKQDSICDPAGCETYGYLEAFWDCGFCTKSTATEPSTWSRIKATYR